MSLVTLVASDDRNREEPLCRAAVGVVGDLAHAFKGQVKGYVTQPPVQKLIHLCMQSQSPSVKNVGIWAQQVCLFAAILGSILLTSACR